MDKIIDELNEFYKEQLSSNQHNAQKVNWKNEQAQTIRFRQLVRLLPEDTDASFSVADLGCGIGDLSMFIADLGYQNCEYTGYDVSAEMIEEAKKTYRQANVHFEITKAGATATNTHDYYLASGIFNKKLHLDTEEWKAYIAQTLDSMHQKASKGFAFNMLTSYSDADKRRNDLYYADPLFYFDYCKRHFSKEIALLHDYQEYDFTILVRK